MRESEVMQRQQQLANDLWQQVITMDEFVAGMDAINVETDNFEGGAQMTNQPQNLAVESDSELSEIKRLAGITENEAPHMSTGAAQVVARTLDAVQDLDEMGGSESRSDYVIAMNELIGELTRRRDTAAHLMKTDGNNFG